MCILLGTQWFLMGIDRNYKEIDGNCREIDLFEVITLYREILRERENALSNKLIYSSLIFNV